MTRLPYNLQMKVETLKALQPINSQPKARVTIDG